MKDKKQKNEQNAGAIAAKPKKKKKGTDRCAGYCGSSGGLDRYIHT